MLSATQAEGRGVGYGVDWKPEKYDFLARNPGKSRGLSTILRYGAVLWPFSQVPNQRLQWAGAPGSTVEWLVSASAVVQVLCSWRAVARR